MHVFKLMFTTYVLCQVFLCLCVHVFVYASSYVCVVGMGAAASVYAWQQSAEPNLRCCPSEVTSIDL